MVHLFGLEPLLLEHDVDLAVWAHAHSYERFLPVYDYEVRGGGDETDPYLEPRAPVHIITGSAVRATLGVGVGVAVGSALLFLFDFFYGSLIRVATRSTRRGSPGALPSPPSAPRTTATPGSSRTTPPTCRCSRCRTTRSATKGMTSVTCVTF